MLKPLLFAAIAALGNGIFVFGQRAAPAPINPFLFVAGAVSVCALLFIAAALVTRTAGDGAYLIQNWKMIVVAGIGFVLTYIGFFLLYNNYGAAQYTLYAVMSILTTTMVVGVLIYREPFNLYHMAAVALAIAAIALFTIGNGRG